MYKNAEYLKSAAHLVCQHCPLQWDWDEWAVMCRDQSSSG